MFANKLFADQQHGYVPKRSCMTQLLCVIKDWTKCIDQGNSKDTVFMDYQKAFDSRSTQMILLLENLCKSSFRQNNHPYSITVHIQASSVHWLALISSSTTCMTTHV